MASGLGSRLKTLCYSFKTLKVLFARPSLLGSRVSENFKGVPHRASQLEKGL